MSKSRRHKTKHSMRDVRPCCFHCDLWERVLAWKARQQKQAGYEERKR